MNRVMSKAACAVAALLLCVGAEVTGRLQTQRQTSAPADLKIRQRMSAGGKQGMETLVLVKGARMRSEMNVPGMAVANITQCDLKRTITINDKARTYMISEFGGAAAAAPAGQPAPPPGAQATPRRGGVVNVTNTVTDTGERKEMFGFTARRIKTSMVREASPDSCEPGSSRVESDGWYIDLQFDFSCPNQKAVTHTPGISARPDCEDEIRTRTVGSAKLGYPVMVTTTIQRDGAAASTMTQEVLELSRAPLDASLFDVPAGYALARNSQELYGVSVAAVAARGSNDGGGPSAAVPAATTTPPSATNMTPPGTPKKEGVVRIGLVTPKAQLTAGDAAQAAEAVRNAFADYLRGPSVEVVKIEARLPQQALEEARQSQCDFVLYASLTQKKGGGGGMFGRALNNVAGAAAGRIPGGNSAGEAAARSAAVGGVYTTASIASQVKARDSLSLEYKLESAADARPAVSRTEKETAKSDGEDVLTTLIERAAGAVVAAATKK